MYQGLAAPPQSSPENMGITAPIEWSGRPVGRRVFTSEILGLRRPKTNPGSHVKPTLQVDGYSGFSGGTGIVIAGASVPPSI